jgi:hypothetical protein
MSFPEGQGPKPPLSEQRVAAAEGFNKRYGISDALGLTDVRDVRSVHLYMARSFNNEDIRVMRRIMNGQAISLHGEFIMTLPGDEKQLEEAMEAGIEINNMIFGHGSQYADDRVRYRHIGEAVSGILREAASSKYALRIRKKKMYQELAADWKFLFTRE